MQLPVQDARNSNPSDDRPWLDHYPACVPANLEYPPVAAYGLLEQTAREFPDRVMCHYYKQTVTFAEMVEASRRTASALVELGVQPGDRVGGLLPNLPEYISILNGIWMAGGVAVAISPLSVPQDVSDLLRATDCRIVVCLDLLAPLVTSGDYQPEHVLFASLKDRLPHWQRLGYAFAKIKRLGFWPPVDAPNQHSLEDCVAAADPNFVPITVESIDQPAYILATGGTTGSPKAVTLSHRNLVANAWQIYHWAGARKGRESMLAVLPFFHSYGLTTTVMAGTALAATLILHHRFVPRIVLRLVEKYQPSIFPAVPAMLTALNEILREQPIEFRNLRFVISGGAPLPTPVAEEFVSHTGATVVQGFGLSEAGPVTHAGPLDGSDRPGTIGLPLPDTEARIVDVENGSYTLAPGEIGELLIRGPQVMLGYWENPVATAEVIRDGWLYTGDLGTQDKDGFFKIVDRKKDLIITSGFNVYPTDVEHILRQFPGLNDVAVFGVPDLRKGELVKAVLVMEPGVEFKQSQFDEFTSQRLAKHKRPQLVEVSDYELPKNFLGKVLRKELREKDQEANVEQQVLAAAE